ncbi:hypothetical protein MKX03_006384 [Papaver bracteatum]|nr:hypothetical protein MKX03_006384 [Papaver bracteatum]
MSLLGQIFLLAIGGNDGTQLLVHVRMVFICFVEEGMRTVWRAKIVTECVIIRLEKEEGKTLYGHFFFSGGFIATAVSLFLVREVVRVQHCKDNWTVIVTIYKPLM